MSKSLFKSFRKTANSISQVFRCRMQTRISCHWICQLKSNGPNSIREAKLSLCCRKTNSIWRICFSALFELESIPSSTTTSTFFAESESSLDKNAMSDSVDKRKCNFRSKHNKADFRSTGQWRRFRPTHSEANICSNSYLFSVLNSRF